MTQLTARIYNPRWKREDIYTFALTKESMTVSMGPRKSRCVWRDGSDPKWEGQSLEDMLQNDSVYPPSILPGMLEHLWKSWRNGSISAAEAQGELRAVEAWLNSITKSKPHSDFWKKCF